MSGGVDSIVLSTCAANLTRGAHSEWAPSQTMREPRGGMARGHGVVWEPVHVTHGSGAVLRLSHIGSSAMCRTWVYYTQQGPRGLNRDSTALFIGPSLACFQQVMVA
jgi:hypothetical protein